MRPTPWAPWGVSAAAAEVESDLTVLSLGKTVAAEDVGGDTMDGGSSTGGGADRSAASGSDCTCEGVSDRGWVIGTAGLGADVAVAVSSAEGTSPSAHCGAFIVNHPATTKIDNAVSTNTMNNEPE